MGSFMRSLMIILWICLFALIFFGIRHFPVEKKIEQEVAHFSEVKPPIVNQAEKQTDNIYTDTRAGMLSAVVKDDLFRVYVPNSFDNTVTVIDPKTYTAINTFVTGKNPQHVAPSYDLKTLWVLNNLGNSITPINPQTGQPGITIPIFDPYNMYFTPDGKFALVMAEAVNRIDFLDARTMKLVESVPALCNGVNHLDFSADGSFAVISCEFSGQLVKLDLKTRKIVEYIWLNTCSKKHSMPQDVRLSPDGRTFYVADMMLDGVFLIDAKSFRQLGFINTGKGTHSIYPSRDGALFYVGNRGCNSTWKCPPRGPGSVAVIDPKQQKVIAVWPVPGGGSPDMGNITSDGKELWLSGRYDREVYVFDTEKGQLTHRIRVGGGPHGLTVWPQPGRFSLGHTGNMR